MRMLHTADLHLRTPDDERWEALEAVMDKAAQLNATAVVISGDMFDKSVEVQRLKAPLRELFEKRSIPVVILPGNHDEKGFGRGDYFGEGVTVIEDPEQTVDFGLVRIVGVPYENVGPERVLEKLLRTRDLVGKEEGAINVLLFHGELLDLIPSADAFGDEEGYNYMPARLSTFAGLGYDYILAGHFHRGYDVRRFDGGYFVYPGSPVSITRAETGRRHAVVVDAGEPPRPVALDTRYAERLEVRLNPFDRVGPFDDIRRRLGALYHKAAVYLVISGFADVEAAGMTEQQFGEEMKRLELEPNVVEVVSKWRDVGVIMQNELFKRINERLNETEMSDENRTAVREMVIDALTETIHAD